MHLLQKKSIAKRSRVSLVIPIAIGMGLAARNSVSLAGDVTGKPSCQKMELGSSPPAVPCLLHEVSCALLHGCHLTQYGFP